MCATNIWQSYPVTIIVGICLVLAVGWLLGMRKLFPRMWERDVPARQRLGMVIGAAVLAGFLGVTFNLKSASVGHERAVNEMANNGAISFVAAAWTHHLDFAAFYKTMPLNEAYVRTRRLLEDKNAQFVADGNTIRRKVTGDPSKPKLNVVILLEESLGSEFWGCLGRKETLTPQMDKFAEEEGMLFTNIYACGNRIPGLAIQRVSRPWIHSRRRRPLPHPAQAQPARQDARGRARAPAVGRRALQRHHRHDRPRDAGADHAHPAHDVRHVH